MSWLTINGINAGTLASSADEPTGERRDIGGESEAADGSLQVTRQATKRDFSFGSVPLSGLDARAWEGLIRGEGHVWGFESPLNLYSSKGKALVASDPAPDVEISGPNAKYGSMGLFVANGSYVQADDVLGSTWSLVLWGNVGAGYQHFVIRSDGAKWEDGVRNDALVTTDWLLTTGGDLRLLATGFDAAFDDVVLLPYLVPTSWPAQLEAKGSAFPNTPFVEVAGDVVREAASRTMLGKTSESVMKVASSSDLRKLSIELRQQ